MDLVRHEHGPATATAKSIPAVKAQMLRVQSFLTGLDNEDNNPATMRVLWSQH